MEDGYAEAQVRCNRDWAKNIEIRRETSNILTKEPGLTHLIEFSMNTGDHPPIFQRAYSTTTSLVESVNKELQWLLSKGYIRPSQSPWASPMITVRKPDGSARLCMNFFKVINNITQPVPFCMPRFKRCWRA